MANPRTRVRPAALVILLAAAVAAPPPATAADGEAPWPAVAENGRLAFVDESTDLCSSCFDIFTVRPGGTGRRQLTHGGFVHDPAWSPNGRRILYSKSTGELSEYDVPLNDIWVMGSRGRHKRRLVRHPGDDLTPSWAPGGRRFVFSSVRRGTHQLHVYNFRTRRVRTLTRSADWLGAYQPSWSPDGSRIAFVGDPHSEPDEQADLYTIRPDGTGLRRLTTTPAFIEEDPDWASRGRWLVYGRRRGWTCSEIRIVRRSGDDSRRVPGVCAGGPTWSPDGRWIAVSGLTVLRPDGTRRYNLGHGGSPDWGVKPSR